MPHFVAHKNYMNLVIIFPNEDSFYRKMGLEVYENYEIYRNLFNETSKSTKIRLKDTLIYENIPYEWDVVSKRVAVLLTSIGFYRIWKDKYQMEGKQFVGYGTGYLAALVCEGILKESDAIEMLHTKRVNPKVLSGQTISRTWCLSKGTLPQSEQDILEEIEYCLCQIPDSCRLNSLLKNFDDILLEIGPDNRIAKKFNNRDKLIIGWLDRKNDNCYILENFQQQKFLNRQFAVRKILANIVGTQNYNPEESSQDIVMRCYVEVRRILDDSLRGGTNQISDNDWFLCMRCLRDNFVAKNVPEDEINIRLNKLENETLIDFRGEYKKIEEY